MSTSKSTAASPTDNSKVADDTKVVLPEQKTAEDVDQDSGCDEKVTVGSKVKAFVVTNKKSLLASVAVLASIALVKLAKAQKMASEILVEDENDDEAGNTASV